MMQIQEIIERLKKKRVAMGLTVEEVSHKTKINSMVITHLEQGDFTRMNSVYLRGFLKIYINFLGLDQELLPSVDEYFKKVVVTPAPQSVPVKRAAKKNTVSPAQEKITSAISFLISYRKMIATVLITVVIFILVLHGFSALIRAVQTRKPASRRAKVVNQAAPVRVAAVTPQPKIEVPVQKIPEIHVTIRAKKDCYVRVRKDGIVVFDGIVPRGTAETWVAHKEIETAIGDSTAVDVEANGEFLSLGKKRRSIKSLKITPSNVTIQ